MLKELPGIEKVTLTTNGILLKEQMAELAEAGIDNINISLDTLNTEAFKKNNTKRGTGKGPGGIERSHEISADWS